MEKTLTITSNSNLCFKARHYMYAQALMVKL